MHHPMLWIVLAVQTLLRSQGLPARELQPLPQPLVPAVGLAERQAQWHSLRILDMDDDGRALRVGEALEARGQAAAYRQAGAQDALDLYRQSRRARAGGALGLVLAPLLGGALGLYVGNQYYESQTPSTVSRGSDTGPAATAFGEIAVGGLVLGLVTGGVIKWIESDKAQDLRAQAAESYNRKLLRDLRLGFAPQGRGAKLGLQARF